MTVAAADYLIGAFRPDEGHGVLIPVFRKRSPARGVDAEVRSLKKLPEDQAERSTSKRAVSRRFVALSQKQMTAWLSEPLSDLDVRVLGIDGIVFHDQ